MSQTHFINLTSVDSQLPKTVNLKPVNDIIAKVRETALEDAKRSYQRRIEDGDGAIKRIETLRRVFADLCAAGFTLHLDDWERGANYTLDLGMFKKTKKGNAALNHAWKRLRSLFKLGTPSRSAVGKDTIRFTYEPEETPGLCITFYRKADKEKDGKQPKCRIVTHKSVYHSLVCER